MSEPRISTDKVCALVEALRELAGVDAGAPGGALDNDGDDSTTALLDEQPNDSRLLQVRALLYGLNEDERVDLAALVLVGREDFESAEWRDAVTTAADGIADEGAGFMTRLIVEDLSAPEFLEAGLESFGRSCADYDSETLTLADEISADAGEPQDIGDAAHNEDAGHGAIDPRVGGRRDR